MNSLTIGIIIALLIVFLVGILVGYALVKHRLNKQTEALKISQRRLTEIEQSHELRLREATDQLRRDYEKELAETIEHYQDQLSQKTVEMEQIYETRFRVLQQGEPLASPEPQLAAVPTGIDAVPDAPIAAAMPSRRDRIQPTIDEPDAPQAQPELLHLKRQYEMRLQEAAQKLQTAYEKQLTEHAKTTRAELHAEFEQRWAAQLATSEQAFAERQAELEQALADQAQALTDREQALTDLQPSPPTTESMFTGSFEVPTPSQIMGTGDETTMTLGPGDYPPAVQEAAAGNYTQAELDAEIQVATERLQAEYEQKLASQSEELQAQFDQQLHALDTSRSPAPDAAPVTPDVESSEPVLPGPDPNDVASLFDDDVEALFGTLESDDEIEPPPPAPAEAASLEEDWLGDNKDDDDDDFGPLDLSDISELT
ncbi:MAG: hypothetical protein ACFB0G_24370 [Leptolyngbyaceae cyanobacterium]